MGLTDKSFGLGIGGNKMAEFKLVLSRKDGKSFQKVVKDDQASVFLKKSIKDKVDGKELGMDGYEFEISGGSDKCGFPMRKGILQTRQKITLEGDTIGYSGKNRNKKGQKGLKRKRTVCGERINSKIVQINLKILKEGKEKLGEESAEGKTEEVKEKKAEVPKEEAKSPVEEKKEAEPEKKEEEAPAEKKEGE